MKRVTCFQLSNSSFLKDDQRDKLEVILSTKCLDEIQQSFHQQPQQPSVVPTTVTSTTTTVSSSTSTSTSTSATTEFDHLCNTCSIRFNDKDLRNNHYRSQLHRYNLKLKMAHLPILGEKEFEQMTNNKEEEEDSDSDSSGGSDSESEKILTNAQSSLMDDNDEYQGYQFYETSIEMNDPKLKIVSKELKLQVNVWRCILGSTQDFRAMSSAEKPQLVNTFNRVCRAGTAATTPLTWAVLLCSGGRFAGALYKAPNLSKSFEHKTFHRYTTRKKQGGSQSTKDSQGGNKKSAGAAMRRYNEKRLREEVAEVLESWKSHLQQCNYIFVFAPKGNTRDILFYPGGPIAPEDQRIRNIPFPIIRPTYSETQRVTSTLFSVDIDLLEDFSILEKEKEAELEAELEKEREKEQRIATANQIKQQLKDTQAKQISVYETDILFKATKAKDLNEVKRLLEDDLDYELPIPSENDSIITPLSIAIDNKDNEMIKYLIQILPSDINVNIPKWNFKSCLMKAASDGHVDLVLMLLDGGADPTIKSPITNETVYDSAKGHQKVRDALREWAGDNIGKFDYTLANIPPLTKQMIADREEKKKQKKQQQKEKEKAKKLAEKENKAKEEEQKKKKEQDRLKKVEEAKLVQQVQQTRIAKNDMLTERERRALAAETRLVGGIKCTQCGIPIAGMPFERLNHFYCSTRCVVQHKNSTNVNDLLLNKK